MSDRRLSLGEVLSTAAGVVLVLVTVIPWFHRESSGRFSAMGDPRFDPHSLNAWQAFGVFAILIVVVGAVPVWQAVSRLREAGPPRPQLLLAAGAVAVTLVLGGAAMKLGDRGSLGPGSFVVSTTPKAGLVIAVVAALLMALGGVVAMWGLRPVARAPDER